MPSRMTYALLVPPDAINHLVVDGKYLLACLCLHRPTKFILYSASERALEQLRHWKVKVLNVTNIVLVMQLSNGGVQRCPKPAPMRSGCLQIHTFHPRLSRSRTYQINHLHKYLLSVYQILLNNNTRTTITLQLYTCTCMHACMML